MAVFPQLAFIALHDLVFYVRSSLPLQQEDAQNQALAERIRSSGVWRNPPVVIPLHDGTGRGMVIDGERRIAALRRMAFPYALVQVAPAAAQAAPDEPGLKLLTWNHVVSRISAQSFLNNVRSLPGLRLARQHQSSLLPCLEGDAPLAILLIRRGGKYALCCRSTDLQTRLELLNSLVNSYRQRADVERTELNEIAPLRGTHSPLCALVIFPQITIQELLRASGCGWLLPAGMVSFSIAPRALHLDYPLAELASPGVLDEKNAALQRWLQERLANKGVRYYAEEIVLFDE